MGKLLIKLRKDNMQAMKEKDNVKKGVLSLVIASIALAEKENNVTLDEADELTYIQKELKQVRDSLAQTPSNREDLIAQEKQKIAILESYLPKQMDEEQIKEAILKITRGIGRVSRMRRENLFALKWSAAGTASPCCLKGK